MLSFHTLSHNSRYWAERQWHLTVFLGLCSQWDGSRSIPHIMGDPRQRGMERIRESQILLIPTALKPCWILALHLSQKYKYVTYRQILATLGFWRVSKEKYLTFLIFTFLSRYGAGYKWNCEKDSFIFPLHFQLGLVGQNIHCWALFCSKTSYPLFQDVITAQPWWSGSYTCSLNLCSVWPCPSYIKSHLGVSLYFLKTDVWSSE